MNGATYDLIISNPPYVAAGEVQAFPPEYGHEPIMAHIGGEDGLDLVRRILEEAADHLNPGGGLLCEIGTGRELLVADYPHLDFLWLDTEESPGRSLLDHPRAAAGRGGMSLLPQPRGGDEIVVHRAASCAPSAASADRTAATSRG